MTQEDGVAIEQSLVPGTEAAALLRTGGHELLQRPDRQRLLDDEHAERQVRRDILKSENPRDIASLRSWGILISLYDFRTGRGRGLRP